MLHKAIPAGDIHTVANWEVADAAALNALVPVAGDNGKIAWRQDNNSLYLLSDYTGPTWSFLGSGAVPGSHAASHEAGGSDPIKLDDLAAPDDNTDLNASTTAHGLLVKATAPASGLRNVVGIDNAETAYTNKALFDATVPAALAASAATGSAMTAARRDHAHAVPKLDDCATPDDNTDLNVSITAHGLAPKAPNDATKYLDGTGAYSVPVGSASVATDTIWDAAGDLAVGTGANTAAKLTMGSALQVLRVNAGGTALEYAAAASGDVATDAIWDAAGDLAVGTGANTAAKLTMGSALQVLRVNAGGTALEYATPTSGSGSLTIARWTALDGQPPVTNFATIDTRNAIAVLDFDASTDESMVFVGVIPEGATLTGGVAIYIHWMATSATSGAVIWEASIERSNTDLDSDSFDTVAFASGTASGTSGIITKTTITTTNIDSVVAGDLFRLKISRDADGTNGTDDMTGDAEIVAVELRGVA